MKYQTKNKNQIYIENFKIQNQQFLVKLADDRETYKISYTEEKKKKLIAIMEKQIANKSSLILNLNIAYGAFLSSAVTGSMLYHLATGKNIAGILTFGIADFMLATTLKKADKRKTLEKQKFFLNHKQEINQALQVSTTMKDKTLNKLVKKKHPLEIQQVASIPYRQLKKLVKEKKVIK